MEMNFDNAQFRYIAGTAENDNININNTFLATVNTQQGGYDNVAVNLAEATTFIAGDGMLNVKEGGNNTVALTGQISTVNLGNSHNTNIVGNLQDGGTAHIYAADFSTLRISLPDDKSCTGTWSGENLNTLTLTVTASTDTPVQSQYKFYGVSDDNIPQVFGAKVDICEKPQGETSEEELPPSLDDGCPKPQGETSELEEVPSLDEVIQPPSDVGSDQSKFPPSGLEPIERGTGSVLVGPPPTLTDTPKVNPTSTM